MMDIESHTAIFLRDLPRRRPRTGRRDRVPVLLGLRGALARRGVQRFLGEAGQARPRRRARRVRHRLPVANGRNLWIRQRLGGRGQLSTSRTLLGSSLFDDFVALHMAWGAANELSTLTSYHRLIAKTERPQLVALLEAVIKDERRHFAFYRAARAARAEPFGAPDHPVGDGPPVGDRRDGAPRSRDRLRRDPPVRGRRWGRRLPEMDRTLAELPGLARLRIFDGARRQALRTRRADPPHAPGMWRAVRPERLSGPTVATRALGPSSLPPCP